MKIRKELLEQKWISYAMEHVELPPGGIDCGEGCNPYGFPPECEKVFREFDPSRLGPYPHSDALYDAIRDHWKDIIDVERGNIVLTDGSINALYTINNIFDTHDSMVLGISPQFTDYYMHAEMIGIDYAPYQLKKEFNYKFDTYEFLSMHFIADRYALASMPGKTYNFIYIDNPNNPTGQCIDIDEIEEIVAKALRKDITVIIDEAYGDFMPKENSAIRLFAKYPNLAVVRTLSKGYGLAGMRTGYIIAHKDLAGYIHKMVNPYMVSELAREVGAEALRHPEHIQKSGQAFAEMKEEIRETLNPSIIKRYKKGEGEDAETIVRKLPGPASGRLHMAETLDTNSLLLLYHDDKDIKLAEEFYRRGVLAIDGYDFKGLDQTAARVRLPKKEEFPKLLEAIKEINAL
ncbi:MAG: histidinol-phosphate aminotransferase family protein [Mogibacterium sp.]|nr:histidinol-phosphate aminotransferase family protein [Mogibacterium sp.]